MTPVSAYLIPGIRRRKAKHLRMHTPEAIMDAVCRAFGVTPAMMQSSTRKGEVVIARASFAEIMHRNAYRPAETLRRLGNRQHGTWMRMRERFESESLYTDFREKHSAALNNLLK